MAAGTARLAAHTPEWTDHNTSDPGVTLLELLLYGIDGLWTKCFAAARDGLGHEWPQDRDGSGGGFPGDDSLDSDSDDASDDDLVG